MKCVILAGGKGTRLAEETSARPKPMVEIGGLPILWHIMKHYSHHGISDFVVCLGYKGYLIKEYFANYYLHNADVTFDMRHNKVEHHRARADNWRVTLIDTGEETMTGGRLRRAAQHLDPGEPFCMTYGDGVADLDLKAEMAFHKAHGKKATIACVHPPARFGRIRLEGQSVTSFEEKPLSDGGLINGGYFILHPSVVDYIEDDQTIWERTPLERLAAEGELQGWVHGGFWQPMDTLRDKLALEEAWQSGKAPWKVWD
jgi:glucose-1-phosphate cytidylyltransferase